MAWERPTAPQDRLPEHRRNGFDLIRLLLAAAVMLSHAVEYREGNRRHELLTAVFHTLSMGELAVDAFFILSGFFILQSWDRTPKVRAFLVKRAGRVYPAFIVASLLCLLVVGRLGAVDPAGWYGQLDMGASVLRMLLLLSPDGPPVFAGLPYPFLNSPVWTIHYEFLCYLGVAVAGALGLLKGWRVPVLLWVTVLAAFMIQHGSGPAGSVAVRYDLPGSLTRFGLLFLSGVVCARLGLHRRRSPVLLATAAAALIAGLCVPLLAQPTLATAGAYLLLALGSSVRPRLTLPDISYGTYLYGGPVEMLLLFFVPALPWPAMFALALPIALLLGAASWFNVEAPILRRLASPSRQGVRGSALAGAPEPA